MKRLIIIVLVGLALFYSAPSLFHGRAFAFGGPFFYPMGLPPVFVSIVSILLVAVLLRWAFDGQKNSAQVSRDEEASPAALDNRDSEADVRALDQRASSLEKRLEALETILLERSRLKP